MQRIIAYLLRRPLLTCMFLTLCAATLLAIWWNYRWDLEALEREHWKEAQFKGVVVDRYMVPNSHGEVHTILESDGSREDLYWQEIYSEMALGDSLLKESGSTEAIIKRPDGTTVQFTLFRGEQTLIKWE